MVSGGTFVDDYFETQKYYENKYGKDTVVLIQKGSFYEIYGIYNDEETVGKAKEISEILNIQLTSSNKNIDKNDRKNPNMTGMPYNSLKKYLKVLMEHNYHVVLIDQDNDGIKPTRKVSQIFSPGTYDDDFSFSNSLICIYANQSNGFGVCSIDVNIGKIHLYDISNYDSHCQLEELYRITHSFIPSEVVVFSTTNDDLKHVLNFLSFENCHSVILEDNKTDLSYIKQLISKVYGNSVDGILSKICIGENHNTLVALSCALEYIHEHNENLLENLDYPVQDVCGKMILHNSAIHQLNLLGKSKKCVFNVINMTCTHMGKRRLLYELTNPYTDIDYLCKYYDNIEQMMQGNTLDMYYEHLKHVCDIEKLVKKLSKECTKYEIMNLYNSLTHAKVVLGIHNECNKELEKCNLVLDTLEKTFNFTGCKLFKNEVHVEYDNMYAKYTSVYNWIENCMKKLSKYVNKKKKGETSEQIIKLEGNSKSGYTLIATPLRGEIIKSAELSKSDFENYGEIKIKKDKSKCTIYSESINDKLHQLIKNEEHFKDLEASFMKEFVSDFYKLHNIHLMQISDKVSEIDVLYSKAKLSQTYNYCKPQIKQSYCSYINAKNLRHAHIELLDSSVEYIPNDVYINPNENDTGILLYGVNGSGKSCYSKALGLCIILAQIGMWVPCDSFQFSPYHRLFTRINCDDNIFQGQSSFFVEMTELKSILKYSDQNSIVIGDEICKGTEDVSALAIVGSTIEHLLNNNSGFVFATHLHRLPQLSCLKDRADFKIMHISVDFSDNHQYLKYTRKLCEGICDSVYGLEIANYILQNPQFYRNAYKLRNEVISKPKLMNTKKSKYNKGLFVDSCEICGSRTDLEVHHIEHQKTTQMKQGNKTQKSKNDISNLVVMCETCHDKHHSGNIEIKGWVSTSVGRKLEYNIIA